jgi:hypothetical protein
MKKIEHCARFLEENGILFELNRQILHPLGMELRFRVDEDGDLESLELLDNRDEPTPIYFTAQEFDEGRAKYEKYLRDHGRLNMQKRRRMGVVTQTGPNMPHHVHGRE